MAACEGIATVSPPERVLELFTMHWERHSICTRLLRQPLGGRSTTQVRTTTPVRSTTQVETTPLVRSTTDVEATTPLLSTTQGESTSPVRSTTQVEASTLVRSTTEVETTVTPCNILLDSESNREHDISDEAQEAETASFSRPSSGIPSVTQAEAHQWHTRGGSEMSGDNSDVVLEDDLLSHIFLSLAPRDLAQAAMVSRRWRRLALCQELQAQRFLHKWGFERVSGVPSRFSFWVLDHPPFVIRHVLKPIDSITSVALQYGCQSASIRRTNNMMSDHAIHSRAWLLIPLCMDVLLRMRTDEKGTIGNHHHHQQQQNTDHDNQLQGRAGLALGGGQHLQRDQGIVQQESASINGGQQASSPREADEYRGVLLAWLRGKKCSIELDAFAKRDVAIVGSSLGDVSECEDATDEKPSEEAIRRDAAKKAEARARIVKMLVRACGVDEATAAYYLEEANGDVRAASQELRNDMRWEHNRRTRR